MRFSQEKFAEFIINNNVIGFFDNPIKLKSGRTSNWYVNWRTVSEDVFLMDKLTDFIIAFTKESGLNPDSFYGVPEGATKLGLLTQYKWARVSPDFAKGSHSFPMGRAKPKEHGDPKDRFFVGAPKGKIIILEDVTTTGLSLLNTIESLKEIEVEIIAAFGLTNRMERRDDGLTVQEAVEKKGVRYFSLSNALDLLPIVYERRQPGIHIAAAIEQEFEKYGIEKIKIR